jgi:hypothetical protein
VTDGLDLEEGTERLEHGRLRIVRSERGVVRRIAAEDERLLGSKEERPHRHVHRAHRAADEASDPGPAREVVFARGGVVDRVGARVDVGRRAVREGHVVGDGDEVDVLEADDLPDRRPEPLAQRLHLVVRDSRRVLLLRLEHDRRLHAPRGHGHAAEELRGTFREQHDAERPGRLAPPGLADRGERGLETDLPRVRLREEHLLRPERAHELRHEVRVPEQHRPVPLRVPLADLAQEGPLVEADDQAVDHLAAGLERGHPGPDLRRIRERVLRRGGRREERDREEGERRPSARHRVSSAGSRALTPGA